MYEYGDGQNTDPCSWTPQMDYQNGLPLKWTTPKNNILNEYCKVVTLYVSTNGSSEHKQTFILIHTSVQ